MTNNPREQYSSLGIKPGLKLLAIVAFWQTIVMILPFKMESISPLIAAVFDIGVLVILSGLSGWFLVLLPENKKSQKTFSQSLHSHGQEMRAIDQLGIVTTADLDGKITYANDNFCKISGYSREELVNHDHRIVNSNYHSKEFFKEMWTTLKAGKPWRGEIRNQTKEGEFYWVDSYIVPIFDTDKKPYKYISFRFDITAEKLIEEALEQEKVKSIHMGRLSAIGEMAAGIAHEINNPLTIINGFLSVVDRKLQSPNAKEDMPKILEHISKTKHQIIRMSKIINALREFSRSGDDQPFENESVDKIFESVASLITERVNRLGIRIEMQSRNIEFQCNIIQIEQVLVNLINNSIDAISDLEEKWIKIEASSKGEFVEISVMDSGLGINREIAQKIMQPFFTTKDIGKGTGLGLSISRGIIEKHGGILYPDLEAKNTKFVIQIPLNESVLIDLINIDEVISGHLAWRHKLLNLITNPNSHLDLSEVTSDGHCEAGKWLKRIQPRFIHNPQFIELEKAHTEFHKCAGEIIQRIREGDLAISELTLGSESQYDLLSKRVVLALKNFSRTSSSSKIPLAKCS